MKLMMVLILILCPAAYMGIIQPPTLSVVNDTGLGKCRYVEETVSVCKTSERNRKTLSLY